MRFKHAGITEIQLRFVLGASISLTRKLILMHNSGIKRSSSFMTTPSERAVLPGSTFPPVYIVFVTTVELMSSRARQQQLLQMNLHLLANPGDSLLLQHTLDRLIRWLCPSLRIFHVSERASPFRSYTRLCPVAGRELNCFFSYTAGV